MYGSSGWLSSALEIHWKLYLLRKWLFNYDNEIDLGRNLDRKKAIRTLQSRLQKVKNKKTPMNFWKYLRDMKVNSESNVMVIQGKLKTLKMLLITVQQRSKVDKGLNNFDVTMTLQ